MSFAPSAAVRHLAFDEEGRVYQAREGSADEAFTSSNRTYPTVAEELGTLPPFLRANKLKDLPKRNYFIRPGSGIAVFRAETRPEDKFVGMDYVTAQESFGHYTQPSGPIAPSGRGFQLGDPGKAGSR